jgi:two-component system sensor histidine kinase UhpB
MQAQIEAQERSATLAQLINGGDATFKALADSAPVLIRATGPDGLCTFSNARWLTFGGRRLEQELGRGWLEALHAHDRQRCAQRYAKAFEGRKAFSLEYRMKRVDGKWRWIRDVGVPYYGAGGDFLGYLSSAVDVSELKETEAALQRELFHYAAETRKLWLRLVDVQENERRKLSMELHDNAGEALTALRLHLAALERLVSEKASPEVRRELDACVKYTLATNDVISDVMTELRPPMLDDFGLAASLRWYAAQFAKRTGIETGVTAPEEPPRLAPQVENVLFRIAQECLRNVAKHAKASRVDVTLAHDGGVATLTLEDDGVGFGQEMKRANVPPWRWGMVTMRERAYAINARLDVASTPGQGTCITVTTSD